MFEYILENLLEEVDMLLDNGMSLPDDWSTWARTHDVVLDVTGVDLSLFECEVLYRSLPSMIRSEAVEYGFNDTCYGELLHVYVRANPEKVVKLKGVCDDVNDY